MISATPIPTISEEPVKSLGKFFDSSLRDTAFIKNTCEELEGWLKTINRTGLPAASHYLKRWLGLPQSLISIALYGNACKLSLPLKSIEEELKVLHTREVLQLWESKDPKVSGAGDVVKTDRKRRAEVAVEQVESCLWHGVLVGSVARGRAGLGAIPFPCCDRVWREERRQLV